MQVKASGRWLYLRAWGLGFGVEGFIESSG